MTGARVKLSGMDSVVGRALVVHTEADDLGASDDQAGNAGAPVACCNIYRVPTQEQYQNEKQL